MSKKIRMRKSPHNKSVNHGPNISQATVLGPFPGTTTPTRPGIFKRESYNTKGKLLWSYWTGNVWSLMGTNFDRAIKRKGKASARQDMPWYGMAKVEVLPPSKNGQKVTA